MEKKMNEEGKTTPIDDEEAEALGIMKNVKEICVDSSKEDSEKKYVELKGLADDFLRLKKSSDYARLASVEGIDFSEATKKETDIVRAYFQSEAFRQRVVKSFGYESLDEMPPRDRQEYDMIMDNAKELVTHLKVGLLPPELCESLGPCCYPNGEDTIVLIDPNDKEGLGLSSLAHELAHHLYTSCCVNPGIREDERKYGVEDSPLNTINASKITEEGIRRVYKDYDKHVSVLAAEIGLNDAKKIANGFVKLHDNAGKERAADIHGVRLLMLQEGIWNPFTGEPVTVKQVEDFRKAHPDSRIFEYWSDKEAVYFLNNIAMSEKVKPDGVRLGYGVDGECHLVATVGGSTVDKVITQRDYDKLLALDDGKRGVLMSRLLGDEGCTLDLSDGVALGELLAKEELKPSEERNIDGHGVGHRENVDYLAMSSANFESVSRDLDDGEQVHRGMSV